MDPYASCPCGSGKKFKWCCQPIDAGIRKAMEQEAHGQHDTALRVLDELTKEHPGNPQVSGQRARLLYAHGQTEAAEEVLQKAFDLNPSYPFGLFLHHQLPPPRGGAERGVLLARKAADAYDPEARDQLAEVYRLIFDCEWRRQRPLSAGPPCVWCCILPRSMRARGLRPALWPRRPAAGMRPSRLHLLPPAPAQPRPPGRLGGRRQRPDSDFSEAVHFEALTKGPDDAPAWFNLGLSKSWLGDNKGALGLRPLPRPRSRPHRRHHRPPCWRSSGPATGWRRRAITASTASSTQLRNFEAIKGLLDEFGTAAGGWRSCTGPDQEDPTFLALILEHSSSGMVTVEHPSEAARLSGYLALIGSIVQVARAPARRAVQAAAQEEVRTRLGIGLGEMQERKSSPSPSPRWSPTPCIPPRFGGEVGGDDPRSARRCSRRSGPTGPRRALAGNAPIDAVGRTTKLRKKLLGVVQYIQELHRRDADQQVRFRPVAAEAGPEGNGPGRSRDGAYQPGPVLGEAAWRACRRSNCPTSSSRTPTSRHPARREGDRGPLRPPPAGPAAQAGKADRFPFYTFLITKALADGEADAALDLVNEGEKTDCEHNEGRRRNDFELKHGQVHVKRGEAEQAHEVFERLIERVPSNFRYRGAAAEAMLALKKPNRALRFAEEGVQAAQGGLRTGGSSEKVARSCLVKMGVSTMSIESIYAIDAVWSRGRIGFSHWNFVVFSKLQQRKKDKR